MLRRSAGHRTSPLIPVLRSLARFLPLVAALGLVASLLEGAGIGLFIPLIALLLSNAGGAAVPPLLGHVAALFDGFDPRRRSAILAGAIFALILLKGAVQAANDRLAASVQGRIGVQIRTAVARKLLELDYPFFLEADRVRLSHIVSTDCWFVLSATQSALTLIPAAAGLLVFAALLAWLNVKLFLVVLVGGLAVQATLRLFEKRQAQLSYEFTAGHQRVWERLLTLVQAPRVIRLFGQQQREQQRTSAAIEQLRDNVMAGQTLKAVVQPALDAMMALLFLVVLVAGYWSGMSVAAITVFLLLLSRALPQAKTISTARFSIVSLRGSLWEVEWLLSQPSPASVQHSIDPDLRIDRDIGLDNLSYVYPDGSRVLDGLTATIKAGSTTALMGESGSGKTTLVNLLCRLLEPQSGDIRLGDESIRELDREAWRRRVAVAGQDSELVTGTVFENIAYARPDASMADVAEAARAAGAEEFIAGLPHGYDTRVGPSGLSLSGGQRQRIGLARALMARPDLLILDEASNAVDAASEAKIMKLISGGRFFRTGLVISHRKLTLGHCDYGIVLDKGRVSEAGPLSSLNYFRDMAGESR
ncbi:ABC transporter ATP-binding protein [Sphingomonas sp.]|uniref:ABC transporter ATP-binding protein n=1 Tax=Sphingomonas sp. TaxID=28214 RepID=UPI0038B15B7A